MQLTPLPFESFSSWFLAYCRLMVAAPMDVAEHFGIVEQIVRRPMLRIDVEGLDDAGLARVAHASGVGASSIASTWLTHRLIQRRVDELLPAYDRVLRARHLAYCPRCLDETDGRWDLRWRLPWRQACVTHRVRLVEKCWVCDRPQHHRQLQSTRVDEFGWRCTQPQPRAVGRQLAVCGADLREGATSQLEPRESQVIAEFEALIEEEPNLPSSAVQRLHALLATARYLNATDPPDVRSAWRSVPLTPALGRAHDVLGSEVAFAGVALRELRRFPPPFPRRLVDAPAQLEQRFARIRRDFVTPLDQLRWSMAADARPPWRTGDEARMRRALRPQALWMDWAIRVAGWLPTTASTVRIGAALALNCVGTAVPVRDLEQVAWDLPKVRNFLTLVHAADHQRITACLVQLSEALDRHGSPIDYDRRSRVFGPEMPPLSARGWKDIAVRGGVSAGRDVKLLAARRWLWETLTGRDAGTLGLSYRLGSYGDYHRFLVSLTPATITALNAYAAQLLVDHGIEGEPVSWSPPASWVEPGLVAIEPDSLDTVDVLARLATGRSMTEVAQEMDLPVIAIAWTIRSCPPALRLRAAGPPRSRPLPPLVTSEWVVAQLEGGTSIRTMARSTGVPRKRLAALVAASAQSPRDATVTRRS